MLSIIAGLATEHVSENPKILDIGSGYGDVTADKMGEWSLVSLYLLPIFMAFPIAEEIPGTRNFFTGTAGMSLAVKALNFALRTLATSFARVTSFLKNSVIIIIMKSRWAHI
jgi:hypothetical protein